MDSKETVTLISTEMVISRPNHFLEKSKLLGANAADDFSGLPAINEGSTEVFRSPGFPPDQQIGEINPSNSAFTDIDLANDSIAKVEPGNEFFKIENVSLDIPKNVIRIKEPIKTENTEAISESNLLSDVTYEDWKCKIEEYDIKEDWKIKMEDFYIKEEDLKKETRMPQTFVPNQNSVWLGNTTNVTRNKESIKTENSDAMNESDLSYDVTYKNWKIKHEELDIKEEDLQTETSLTLMRAGCSVSTNAKNMRPKFKSGKDEQLINLIKQYPALYNCKLKDYKDVVAKNNIWKTIATNLKRPESVCKCRWKNIRDYYKKKRNEAVKLAGTGSQRSDNEFFLKFKHLFFLEDTAIMDRETISSVDTEEIRESENTTELMGKNVETTEQTVVPETTTGESLIPATPDPLVETSKIVKNQKIKNMKARKKIRISNENILAEELKKNNEERTVLIRELLQSFQSQSNPALDPAISMFFQSIAATVSKFTPQLQARAKAEVMNVVAQLELQYICHQNLETNYPNANFTQFSNTVFQSRPHSSKESNSFLVNNLNSHACTDLSQLSSNSAQQIFSAQNSINFSNTSCTEMVNKQFLRPPSSAESNNARSNFSSPICTENSLSFSLQSSSCNSSDENLGPDCVH